MVKIRLKRMGAKKRPFYRLVVADSRSPRDGRFIEEIGVYDPLSSPSKVEIDADKVLAYAGLVRSKRIKQWTFYRRDEARIAQIKRAISAKI